MVDAVHVLCRRCHGLVCGDWLLHPGQLALLDRRRAEAQSRSRPGIDAVGPLCPLCYVGRQQSVRHTVRSSAGGLIRAYL